MPSPSALALALLLAAPAPARGAADCLLGWQVAGAPATAGGLRVVCHDGDGACDADGAADGVCTFAVGLCVNPPTPSRCQAGTVAQVELRGAGAAALAPALAALTLPVSGASACTPAARVAVARGRGMRTAAAAREEGSGRRDRDVLRLRCLRPRRASGTSRAIVVTTDFETGLLAAVRVSPPRTVTRVDQPIHSDAVVRVAGGLVYVVNRFLGDDIQVLDPTRGLATVLQCPTGSRSNPHDVAVLEPHKAYVARYGSPELWVVNPGVRACDRFLRRTIDLSPWADADGIPEMDQLALAGGRLFVTLARLDRGQRFAPAGRGRVVAIDTTTDAVIGVVELSGRNPFGDASGLPHDPATGKLVVAEVGDIYAVGDGGLERVDPVTLAAEGFFITEDDLGGNVTDFVLLSASKGYAIVQDRALRNVLVAFDPSQRAVTKRLLVREAFLPDIALAPDGMLWLADQTLIEPGLRIFDPADDTQVTPRAIDVGLPPFSLGFLP